MNADLLARVLPPLPDRMTPDDWAEVGDVLDAAHAWDTGGLPLEAFARIGTMLSPATGRASAGYTRHVAARVTRPDDPRRAALRRAFDALLDVQGLVITTTGVYDKADIVNIPVVYRRHAA